MTIEHRLLTGASLHNSKVLTFTGDPATYVPPETGIFAVCLTAPNAGKIYRTTGTTAGAVSLLAAGQDGAAATVSIGTVTTLQPDSEAVVTNVGTATNAILDFELPTGPQGATGEVSAAAALTLQEQESITSTAANEIDLVNVANVLQWRLESDGTTYTVASTADVNTRLPKTATQDTLTYAATVDIDLAALTGTYQTISLTGNLTLTSSNRAAGRQVVLRLICDGTQRDLTFPGDWTFIGTMPANIAASKTGMLSLIWFGTTDADCIAEWKVEA